jgi:hypothetical protein
VHYQSAALGKIVLRMLGFFSPKKWRKNR